MSLYDEFQKEKSTLEHLRKVEPDKDNVPEHKIVVGGSVNVSNASAKKPEEAKKATVTSYKEKEEKDISDKLNKLKGGQDEGKETLQSKMPSRQTSEEDDEHKEIRIPTSSDKATSNKPTQQDSSIFGGKSEISRSEMRQKLKNDSTGYSAKRDAGLNLSPVDRAKLEKQVFSQALGGNISKSEYKLGIRRLNEKMLSTTDVNEKSKMRKEIKFFKKIGGIK